MLIRGRLQTAISLISLGEATWGSVRAKAEQRKHVRSYQPVAHSEKREAFSLFHLWKEEFKAERSPLPPPSSTVQWRSEIVYQDKRSRFRLLNLSDLPRSLPESRSVSESSNILKGPNPNNNIAVNKETDYELVTQQRWSSAEKAK